jgi:hypothetical protein
VQKVMSQRSASACTRCTRANAFPDSSDVFTHLFTQFCPGIFSHFEQLKKKTNFLLCPKLFFLNLQVERKNHNKYSLTES